MPNATKIERVEELKQQIEGANALLLTEYRGLTVSEITELRRSLREVDASLAVIKNTLMQRAANDAGITELDGLLSGPSAVAFVNGDDVVVVAKKLKDAAKLYPALVLKGGYLDGAPLDAEGANALAELESREVMLSKIAGLMKAEMSRAAAGFVAAQSRFLGLLEAFKEKLPAEAEAEPEPAPAPQEVQPADETATADEAPSDEAAAAEAEPVAEVAADAEAETTTETEAADEQPAESTEEE
jgi:large subunit ribosomal protein L10